MTNTEPQGIKDLRESKANYLDALSNLREADAELVKAQAAYKQAEIAVVNADAALKQAEADIAKALADAAQIGVAYLDERLQMDLEAKRAEAEIAAVEAQERLADAQWKYEQKIREIAAKSIGLTQEEITVLNAKVTQLRKAQKNYHNAFVAVERKKMDIWDKEYDHDSINGKTIEDWEYDIAKAESKIAKDQAKIADLEAMKEVPESIKDYLEAYQDSILDLRKDSLYALQEKGLYEVTTLKEANKAYKEAWDKFVKDSVGDPAKFTFKQESTLLDAKNGLDAQFKVFVETYTNRSYVNFDGNKFTVAVKDAANNKGIDSVVTALKTIVEALNRDQVILDNIADSLALADAEKAYKKADSTYKADYAILKAGLDKYEAYTVANDTLKMYKDTLKAAQKDSAAIVKKLAGDTAVVLKNAPGLALAYINAVEYFVDKAIAFDEATPPTKNDTNKLIAAVNALGEAQAAYIGRQDSVEIARTIVIGGAKYTSEPTNTAFSDLEKADFAVNDPGLFSDILDAANCNGSITEALVGGKVFGEQVGTYNADEDLAFDLSGLSKQDTIAWFKNKAKGAYRPIAADEKVLSAVQVAYDAAVDSVASKQAKVNAAKDKFKEIGQAFWNDENYNPESDDYKIVWSDETFSKPSNCVLFNLAKNDSINPSTTLKVALDGIYKGTDYVNGDIDVNDCPIFFGPDRVYATNATYSYVYDRGTEFTKALYAKQIYDALANLDSRTAQLENINKQFDALNKAYTDAKTSYDKANAAYVAGYTRLTGKKDGAEVKELKEANVENGKWKLAGKQLELANQFAPEYPAIVKNADAGVTAIEEKIADTKEFIEFLEEAYIDYKNLDEGKNYQTIKDITDALDDQIGTQEGNIAAEIENITLYKKNIAKIEAGYDPYSVDLESEYAELERLESELAMYEEQLEIAQKEYDEVIAAYGVNE